MVVWMAGKSGDLLVDLKAVVTEHCWADKMASHLVVTKAVYSAAK
jgi:hypothetical protein